MLYESYPAGEDIMVFINRPSPEPVRYRHVKRGTIYTAISDGQIHLNTFSLEGSVHDYPHQGRFVKVEFQFSGGAPDDSGRHCRYAGPVVIYVGEDGKFWMRPCFEFHDGRFVKEEVS